jgi:hypothetical protein
MRAGCLQGQQEIIAAWRAIVNRVCLGALLLACSAAPLSAAEVARVDGGEAAISEAELEDALSGFDDAGEDAADSLSNAQLDEVLSGFDDHASAAGATGEAAASGPQAEFVSDADLDQALSGFEAADAPPGSANADADGVDAAGLEAESLDEVLAGFDEPDAVPSTGPSAVPSAVAAPIQPAQIDPRQTGSDPAPAEQAPAIVPADTVNPFSPGHFAGSVSFSGVYAYVNRDPAPGSATDFEGITRLRTRLKLEYQADPLPDWRFYADGHAWYDAVYQLIDRDYPQSVKDDYQREIELDELWLRGRLGSAADTKLGRQIVVWGKSDNLRITDVINPLDARELGMVDIEDLRLPVAMSRLDLYRGDWNLSALLIHEVRFDKLPPFGSEYFPLPAPLPPDDKPDSSLQNSQFGLALNGSFSRWDLSLYAANIFDRQPWVANPGTPQAALRHARISMLGAAAVLPMGNWLWKSELAHYPGLRLTGHDQRVARSDVLLGLEYAGFDDTTLSLELADRHLYDYDPLPGGPPRNNWQAAVRYQGDFQHDRLHLAVVGTFVELFDNAAGFVRSQAEYELTDAIDVTVGLVLYQQGELPPTSGLGDNDRVFVDLEWSF